MQIPLRGLKVLVPSAQFYLSRLTKGKVKLYQTGNPERGGISMWFPCTPPQKKNKGQQNFKDTPKTEPPHGSRELGIGKAPLEGIEVKTTAGGCEIRAHHSKP